MHTEASLQDDVKMLMQAKGISQKHLANISGISVSMLSLWMNKKHDISFDKLQAIAKALDSQVRIIKQ